MAHELMHGLAVFTKGETVADDPGEERVAELGSLFLCKVMGWEHAAWYLRELGDPQAQDYEEVGRRLLYLAEHVDIS